MQTIATLVAQSKRGDAEAFRVLSLQFDNKVLLYFTARLGDRDAALDCLQHTLLELWKSLGKFTYTSDEAFFGFVFTIARRQLYRAWGKDEKVLSLDEEDAPDVGVSEHHDRITDIQSALQSLPALAQEIIALKHWSGYSFAEIGTMLGIAETAVRVRHHRSLKQLAIVLHEYA